MSEWLGEFSYYYDISLCCKHLHRRGDGVYDRYIRFHALVDSDDNNNNINSSSISSIYSQ
jgi:23S rRNA maturation mini-RNase III